MMPEIDQYMEIAMGIKPATVEKALEQNPDASAVLVTNPTYYGACSDIEKIAGIVHKKGKLLWWMKLTGLTSFFILSFQYPLWKQERIWWRKALIKH